MVDAYSNDVAPAYQVGEVVERGCGRTCDIPTTVEPDDYGPSRSLTDWAPHIQKEALLAGSRLLRPESESHDVADLRCGCLRSELEHLGRRRSVGACRRAFRTTVALLMSAGIVRGLPSMVHTDSRKASTSLRRTPRTRPAVVSATTTESMNTAPIAPGISDVDRRRCRQRASSAKRLPDQTGPSGKANSEIVSGRIRRCSRLPWGRCSGQR